MSKRKKIYVPNYKMNPANFGGRIAKLEQEIEKQGQIKAMQIASMQNYFVLLSNFASHDLKNAIQNMDSVVSTLDIGNVTIDDVTTIKTCLNSMRDSLDEFYQLSPQATKTDFLMSELASTSKILNKPGFVKSGISFTYILKTPDCTIHQPFHNILQVLNNLIINSIKALENSSDKKVHMDFEHDGENIIISISDNGCGVDPGMKNKIFEIYVSTTGGSGIGLAHSTFALENMDGSIELSEPNKNYNTTFVLKFPISSEK